MGRVYKRVVNMDSGGTRYITCCWADCEEYGLENHKITQHEHARSVPCESVLARHMNYVFCSDRHKRFWLESSGWRANRLAEQHGGRIHGMLPTGSRGMTS